MVRLQKTLVEKISDAIGAAYRPTHVRRVAKAEADAALIAAESEIRLNDLQRRAMRRWLGEESRKQENIETITDQAIPLLDEGADASKVDDDWIVHFFDKTKVISDSEMQQLWAKLLAGEVNQPGTFQKRTINIIADLDKSDAELFTSLCGFSTNSFQHTPLVFEVNQGFYFDHGLNLDKLIHLQSLGLINVAQIGGYAMHQLPQTFIIEYFGRGIQLTLAGERKIDAGHVVLTQAGRQLQKVVKPIPVDGFYEYLLSALAKQQGVTAGLHHNVTVSLGTPK